MTDRCEEQRKLEELVRYYYETAGKSGLDIRRWSNDISQDEHFNLPIIWTSVTREPECFNVVQLEFSVDYALDCRMKPDREKREHEIYDCHKNGDIEELKQNLGNIFGLEAYIIRVEAQILLNHYGLTFDFPDQTDVISIVMEKYGEPHLSSMLREDEMSNKNEQEIFEKLCAPLLKKSKYRSRILRIGDTFDNGRCSEAVRDAINMGFAMLKDEEIHEALENARDLYT